MLYSEIFPDLDIKKYPYRYIRTSEIPFCELGAVFRRIYPEMRKPQNELMLNGLRIQARVKKTLKGLWLEDYPFRNNIMVAHPDFYNVFTKEYIEVKNTTQVKPYHIPQVNSTLGVLNLSQGTLMLVYEDKYHNLIKITKQIDFSEKFYYFAEQKADRILNALYYHNINFLHLDHCPRYWWECENKQKKEKCIFLEKCPLQK